MTETNATFLLVERLDTISRKLHVGWCSAA